MTRRAFVAGAAGAAAAGAAAATVLGSRGTRPAASSLGAAGLDPALGDTTLFDEPLVVDVRDARTGEVSILVGEREVTFTDRALVDRLVRAIR